MGFTSWPLANVDLLVFLCWQSSIIYNILIYVTVLEIHPPGRLKPSLIRIEREWMHSRDSFLLGDQMITGEGETCNLKMVTSSNLNFFSLLTQKFWDVPTVFFIPEMDIFDVVCRTIWWPLLRKGRFRTFIVEARCFVWTVLVHIFVVYHICAYIVLVQLFVNPFWYDFRCIHCCNLWISGFDRVIDSSLICKTSHGLCNVARPD